MFLARSYVQQTNIFCRVVYEVTSEATVRVEKAEVFIKIQRVQGMCARSNLESPYPLTEVTVCFNTGFPDLRIAWK